MTYGTRVGPIIFTNESARSHLVETGEVVTFRKSKRTSGETWWRTSRTGGKQGDCTVEYIGEVVPRPDVLRLWVDRSGFASVEEWREAIKGLNDSVPERGYLYRVETRESEAESDADTEADADAESEAATDGGENVEVGR